jgi:glycosyltransferase involved in cell wall biosynthesis
VDHLIISDIPTPWREPVFQRVYDALGGTLGVIYFKANEKRRLWTFQMGHHPRTIPTALTIKFGDTERFFNPGLALLLLRHRPRVALIFASLKDPSAWLAMSLCRLMGTKVALLDDSWIGRDRGIGALQRFARRVAYNSFGDAYVGTSQQTLTMFRHYNRRIKDEQCFLSHLVADNDHFERRLAKRDIERRFDVMFAGRIAPVKNPLFFAEVCVGIKRRLGECRVLIIGDGDRDLRTQMAELLEHNSVDVEFAGFIPHDRLPDYYAQSRLLLLPTAGDCWGVVLNEAMVAGTPTITSDFTAAAGELVIDRDNGRVLPLDAETWAVAACELLSGGADWESYSARAKQAAGAFNYDRAAEGILSAFRYLSTDTRVERWG